MLIRLSAEIEVAGEGTNLFEVMVAVTWNYLMAEPAAALAEQLRNDKAILLFVRANIYLAQTPSVHISEHELGENLAHGLIGEVIREAGIEAQAIPICQRHYNALVHQQHLATAFHICWQV